MKNLKKNLFIKFVFLLILIIGISIHKDYGVSSDEPNSRLKGIISANYIGQTFFPEILENYKKKFSLKTEKIYNISDLKNSGKIKYYGVVFELPAFVLERLFQIDKKSNQYEFKHLLTHLLFVLSLIYFYKLILFRFNNVFLAVSGVLMLYLSPRIFANSFFNNKDIVFMSLFIISIYYFFKFFKKQINKNIIICSVFFALALGVRINALIIPVTGLFIYLIYELKSQKGNSSILFKNISLFFVLTIFFTIIFWPYLWSNPFSNFIEAFKIMSSYPLEIESLFEGRYILSTEVPFYYLFKWILISTPIYYICFFLIGTIYFIKIFLSNELKEKDLFLDCYIFLLIVITFFSIIILKSTLYNGWRQIYFTYPLIIYFSIYGIKFFFDYLYNQRKYLYFLLLILFINSSYIIFSMHPHQNIYFNVFAGKNFDKKYEMDYWGLSYKQNLEFLIKYQPKGKIEIFNLSSNKLNYHYLIIPHEERKRIEIKKDIKDARYLIDNFYYNGNPKFELNFKSYEIINEIKINDVSINTLYKLK